ncbi:hypothetical protein GCM10009574_036410 [Streptomyces asiaticus]|uniref:Uncharacterized protein n=2 Tax=Streptomyces rhizosphaericus TaxID=114699 RepID=A0ABP4CRE9_9ACTN
MNSNTAAPITTPSPRVSERMFNVRSFVGFVCTSAAARRDSAKASGVGPIVRVNPAAEAGGVPSVSRS